MIRVLERCGEYALALELATQAGQSPESAAEQQACFVCCHGCGANSAGRR
jgi:hypothetical protein